jgi:hypothetical protein
LIALSLLVALAVDGVVINKSTGQPVGGLIVTLVQPSEKGMQAAGEAVTAADGKFTIPAAGGGIQLLQAVYQGVTYTKVAPPASGEAVELAVFNTTNRADTAETEQHMLLLEPVPGELRVRETFILRNESNVTYRDPAGSFRFYLPPMAKGAVKVTASSGAQGMPVTRDAKPVPGRANVYAVDFPVKPGETRFDLQWNVRGFAPPAEFTTQVLHGKGPARLIIPRGVTVKGETLKELGVEPRTQASIYSMPNGAPVTFLVEGAGTISNPAAEENEESAGPPVEQLPPKLYDRLPWILGMTFAILGLAFYWFYRKA